jgi:hypothetical protein
VREKQRKSKQNLKRKMGRTGPWDTAIYNIIITTLGKGRGPWFDRRMEGRNIDSWTDMRVHAPCGPPSSPGATPSVSVGTKFKAHTSLDVTSVGADRRRWQDSAGVDWVDWVVGRGAAGHLDVKRETQRASAGAHRVACFESPLFKTVTNTLAVGQFLLGQDAETHKCRHTDNNNYPSRRLLLLYVENVKKTREIP